MGRQDTRGSTNVLASPPLPSLELRPLRPAVRRLLRPVARAAAPVAEVFFPLDVAAGDAMLPSYGEKGYIVSVFLSEQMREIYVVRYVTEYVWICV